MLTQPQNSTSPLNATSSRADARERRRRARINSATQGWLIADSSDAGEPWEVRVNDISRLGVGFESTEKLSCGDICRIRIGQGPMRLARRIRIVDCVPGARGHYRIGAEFVATSEGEN